MPVEKFSPPEPEKRKSNKGTATELNELKRCIVYETCQPLRDPEEESRKEKESIPDSPSLGSRRRQPESPQPKLEREVTESFDPEIDPKLELEYRKLEHYLKNFYSVLYDSYEDEGRRLPEIPRLFIVRAKLRIKKLVMNYENINKKRAYEILKTLTSLYVRAGIRYFDYQLRRGDGSIGSKDKRDRGFIMGHLSEDLKKVESYDLSSSSKVSELISTSWEATAEKMLWEGW